MKYFLDCEFVEDGSTIDLISIGIVAEDGRELYLQNAEAKFAEASDWVWRNVFPHLQHFTFCGDDGPGRNCKPTSTGADQDNHGRIWCDTIDCPWRTRAGIRDLVREFCLEGYPATGKPELWGYHADYDWVALCQLFGRMIDLPKQFPMYCRDLKQWADQLGNPQIPKVAIEHSALNDARWNRAAYCFLADLAAKTKAAAHAAV